MVSWDYNRAPPRCLVRYSSPVQTHRKAMYSQKPVVPPVGKLNPRNGRQQRSRASTLIPRSVVDTSTQGLHPKLTFAQAVSPTLAPSSPLRFGSCSNDARTNKSPAQKENTQGKPPLQSLRAYSTPAPRWETGNRRNNKRGFSATQSPGSAHDDATELYWRRRGAISVSPASPTGGFPLGSPIEKPQINYNTWILPGRIAFLPRVRKGSLLASQVNEELHEKLANHPVVVMSAPNSRNVVAIAILTSLGGHSVQEKYAKLYSTHPDRACEFGRDFLLIKHGNSLPHDDTPLLILRDGKQMGRRSYVSVAYGSFYVQAQDLTLYRENGVGRDSQLFLDDASFKKLVEYRDKRHRDQQSIDRVKWPRGTRRPSEAQLRTNHMAKLPFAAL
ncbi:hypothetical protein IWX48DRAFT_605492, partial [Phyllosticta citricarpa]